MIVQSVSSRQAFGGAGEQAAIAFAARSDGVPDDVSGPRFEHASIKTASNQRDFIVG